MKTTTKINGLKNRLARLESNGKANLAVRTKIGRQIKRLEAKEGGAA